MTVKILDNHKADINAKGESGWTALHYAASNGHHSVVEYLVNRKADINAQAGGCPSGTPLHCASYYGHLNIIEYLINQKANIFAQDLEV